MLRSSGALQFGDFTLASGKKSPYYVDIKKAITRPEILRAIARGIALIAPDADRIAGVELGAVPIAAAVAMETGKPYIMVRKERKEHGTGKDFEGDLKAGERVRAHGADVSEVVAVVDREEGGRDALASIGVRLRALLTAEELLAASRTQSLR